MIYAIVSKFAPSGGAQHFTWKAKSLSLSWISTRGMKSSRSLNRWSMIWKCRSSRTACSSKAVCAWSLNASASAASSRFKYPLGARALDGHLPLEGEEAVSVVNDCVDLTPYVREDILLEFPQHPLCEPECRGLRNASIGKAKNLQQPGNARTGLACVGRVEQAEVLTLIKNLWVSRSENRLKAANACAALTTAC